MNEKFYISYKIENGTSIIHGGDYVCKYEEPCWANEYDWKK